MGGKLTYRGSLARTVAAVLAVTAALAGMACQTPGSLPASAGTAGTTESEFVTRIKKITYMTENNRSIVKVYGSRKFEYTAYKLADPLRLAVEIPNATLDFEPRRIVVDGKIVSGMMVVRFPKVNSIRLEMELLTDAPFKLTQKPDYLEVQLSDGGAAQPRAAQGSAASTGAAEKGAGDLDLLRTENETLRADNLAFRKETLRLEEENQRLKKEQVENSKQIEEATALSRSLQARVVFMEEQVTGLQAKVGSAKGEEQAGGPSIALGGGPVAVPVPVPVPVPAPLPSPIADPSTAAQKPDDEKVKMAVNQAVATWLKAWRDKNIGKYAACYAPDFRGQDMGLDAWLADKKAKFSSGKKLSITADNVKIGIGPDGVATVVFEQTYQTGSYKDRGLKRLRLQNMGGNWLIVSEEWSPL